MQRVEDLEPNRTYRKRHAHKGLETIHHSHDPPGMATLIFVWPHMPPMAPLEFSGWGQRRAILSHVSTMYWFAEVRSPVVARSRLPAAEAAGRRCRHRATGRVALIAARPYEKLG